MISIVVAIKNETIDKSVLYYTQGDELLRRSSKLGYDCESLHVIENIYFGVFMHLTEVFEIILAHT